MNDHDIDNPPSMFARLGKDWDTYFLMLQTQAKQANTLRQQLEEKERAAQANHDKWKDAYENLLLERDGLSAEIDRLQQRCLDLGGLSDDDIKGAIYE